MSVRHQSSESSIWISLLIHALLAALFIYLLSREPEDGGNTEPIQVESIQAKAPPKRAMKKKNPERSKVSPYSGAKGRHEVSLSDLGMRMDYSTPEHTQTDPSETGQDDRNTSGAVDADGWDLMNPDPRIARFNRYIYTTVQGWLDREGPRMITGEVQVRFCFDGNGNYLESESQYQFVDEDFKKLTAHALHNSFVSRPIPHPYMFTNKHFCIDRVVVPRPGY